MTLRNWHYAIVAAVLVALSVFLARRATPDREPLPQVSAPAAPETPAETVPDTPSPSDVPEHERAAPELEPETGALADAGETTAAPAAPEPEAEERAEEPPPVLRPDEATSVALSRPIPGEVVRLVRNDGAWFLATLDQPADSAKVEAFVRDLLEAERRPLEPEQAAPLRLGLGRDEGVTATLSGPGGAETSLRLGLCPSGEYASVYAAPANDGDDGTEGAFVLRADLRGDMGLWKNSPSESPDPREWLAARALAFDPADVRRLDLACPDKRLVFIRDAAGEWRLENDFNSPGWSRPALERWLRDLSVFSTPGSVPETDVAAHGLDSPDFILELSFADGSLKSVKAARQPGAGVWLETSDRPGLAFPLPDWRLSYCFERDTELFPDAVPAYRREQVRLIDLRRDGDSVKFRRDGDTWTTHVSPHPVRSGRVESLARTLAGWRPLAIASPAFAAAKAARAGRPAVDVILDDGRAFEYRLAGEHPLFPRAYVIVNGVLPLETEAECAAMLFPEYDDVLDRGEAPETEPAAREAEPIPIDAPAGEEIPPPPDEPEDSPEPATPETPADDAAA